ncbi:unnamed protein product [Choristocarpus tenellus]
MSYPTKLGSIIEPMDPTLSEEVCHQIFGDVGSVIQEFSCAWDNIMLMHGSLYVTSTALCFHSSNEGVEAKIMVRHHEIRRCNRGNSALFVPNAIIILTNDGKEYIFRNLVEREQCFNLIRRLLQEVALAPAEGGSGGDGTGLDTTAGSTEKATACGVAEVIMLASLAPRSSAESTAVKIRCTY